MPPSMAWVPSSSPRAQGFPKERGPATQQDLCLWSSRASVCEHRLSAPLPSNVQLSLAS